MAWKRRAWRISRRMTSESEPPATESWLGTHSSVVYVAVLFIVSTVLLAIAFWVQPADSQREPARAVVANLLFTLSGLVFAAVVGTVFFSLPDVRAKLAGTFAELLAQGRIVRLLSPDVQEAITRELALIRTSPGAQDIVSSLQRQLCSSADQAHRTVHFHNYQLQTTLEPDGKYPSLVRESTLITFRAVAHHLDESLRSFRYRLVYLLSAPVAVHIQDSDLLAEFTAAFAEQRFARSDVKNRRIGDTIPAQVLFEFDHEIQVPGEIDARVTIEVLYEKSEDCDYQVVRYPTHAYSCALHYRPEFEYDYTWFSSNRRVSGDFAGEESVQRFHSGIKVSTNDWMLPGEGIVLTWKRKPGLQGGE